MYVVGAIHWGHIFCTITGCIGVPFRNGHFAQASRRGWGAGTPAAAAAVASEALAEARQAGASVRLTVRPPADAQAAALLC